MVADLRSFPASSCCFSLWCDGRESTIGERRPNLCSSTSTFLSSFEAGLREAAAGFVVDAESGDEFLCPPRESVSPADPDDAEEEDSRLPAPPLALSAMSGREEKRVENYYPLSRSGLPSHNMHLAVNLACVAIREEEELTLHHYRKRKKYGSFQQSETFHRTIRGWLSVLFSPPLPHK